MSEQQLLPPTTFTTVITGFTRPGEGEDFDEQQRLWDEQHSIKQSSHLLATSLTPTLSPTSSPTLPPNILLNPPNCINSESDLGYINGQLSFDETFKNCLRNVADAKYLPTFINGTIAGTMNVGTNIVLNNLHEVDALVSKVSIDFYLRLYWRDNRFNMPLYWDRVQPSVRRDGVTITISSIDDVAFWLPDIRFHDIDAFDTLAMTLRVNSSNIFFWSRHIKADFMQPDLTFHNFPQDNQTLHIRYGSYAFNSDYLQLNVLEPAISYNKNYDERLTFTKNPVWRHDALWTNHTTYLSSSSKFQNVVYSIGIARDSLGIMSRFVFPIAILSLIGGFIFWSHPEDRVSLTVTLLLSVAAMYVVVINNIPLVGYLTAIDKYVMLIFIILGLAVLLHQIYYTLSNHAQHTEFMDDLEHNIAAKGSESCNVQAPMKPVQHTVSLTPSATTQRRLRKAARPLRRALVSILFDGRVVISRLLQTLGRLFIVPASGIAILIVFSKRDVSFVTSLTTLIVITIVVLLLEISTITKDLQKAKRHWPIIRELKSDARMVRFWAWVFGEPSPMRTISSSTVDSTGAENGDIAGEGQVVPVEPTEEEKGKILQSTSGSFFSEDSNSTKFMGLLLAASRSDSCIGDQMIIEGGCAV